MELSLHTVISRLLTPNSCDDVTTRNLTFATMHARNSICGTARRTCRYVNKGVARRQDVRSDARSLLAPLKHADERQECLLLAVERKGPADGRSGAVDSAETAGLQELMPITNRSLI